MHKFDLVVVGAGPGGYVAAIKAAQLGLSTALVERGQLGGTCLNRGCVPTKSLLQAANLYQQAKQAGQLGLNFTQLGFDLPAMHRQKDQVVTGLLAGIASLLASNQVELITGEAKLISPQQVLVAGESYQAEHIILATGSQPLIPPIPGCNCPNVVTSDQLLAQPLLFPRLTIIGAGVVGLEFAALYTALGCKVTVLETQPRVLPFLSREISQSLAMSQKQQGAIIHTAAKVTEISQAEEGLVCHFNAAGQEQQTIADGVLLAIGRSCNFDYLPEGLDLAKQGNRLLVNEQLQTSCPTIYAIGDIAAGYPQLAHVASAMGINAACHIAGKKPERNLRQVPNCIFTTPQVATIGLDADTAKQQGRQVLVGKYLTQGNAKSTIAGAGRGFIKIIADKQSKVILGAELFCPEATELISHLSLAIAQKLTAADMAAIIYPHPTLSEGIAEAAEDILGQAIHNQPRRKRQ